MPKGNTESLGGLLLDLAVVTVCGLILAATSQPRPKGRRDPRSLISLDDLSVADIAELPAGHVAPMSDRLNVAGYRMDYLVTCEECGHEFHAGPANTHLIVYTLEPQYTHRQHTCPGNHEVTQRILAMSDLMMFVQAGCRIIVRSDRAECAVRELFRDEDGEEYTLDAATADDLAIHAMAVNAALANHVDGLTVLDHDEDPVLANALLPTEL